jgi:hypothetical protein
MLGLLGSGFFIIMFAAGLGQNAGLSILLQRHGASLLPQMYMANALVLIVLSLATTHLVVRAPLKPIMVVAFGAAAAGVFLLRRANAQNLGWAPGALYVAGFASADISAVLFWSVANRAYDTRDAKRLFPLVAAAGTLGASLSGFFARWVINAVGMGGLLEIWAAALLACAAWSIVAAASLPGMNRAAAGSAPAGADISAEDKSSRFLRWALSTGLVFVVAVTLFGRYLYGTALREAYTSDEALAATNGLLIGVSSGVTFLVQLAVASRLLSRIGVRATGLVYPLAMLAMFAVLYTHFGLPAAMACFFGITTLRQGVQGLVENVLCTPLPPRSAARCMAFATAIGMPVGMVLAGAALEQFRGAPPETAAVLGMAAAAALMVAAVVRGSAYKAALRTRLLKGGSDVRVRLAQLLDDSNATVESVLAENLSPHAPDLLERLRTLARSRARKGPEAAARGGSRWDETGPLGEIVGVRVRESYRLHEALAAFRGLEGADAVPEPVMGLLRGAVDERLRENVAVTLAALRAGTRLPDLDRISLRVLDADRRVRAAAVEVLDGLLPEELRPLVLPLLEESRLAEGAGAASGRYGEDLDAVRADPVGTLLAIPDDWVRATTAYAVAHLETRPHVSQLREFSLSPDGFLAFSAARALDVP